MKACKLCIHRQTDGASQSCEILGTHCVSLDAVDLGSALPCCQFKARPIRKKKTDDKTDEA